MITKKFDYIGFLEHKTIWRTHTNLYPLESQITKANKSSCDLKGGAQDSQPMIS